MVLEAEKFSGLRVVRVTIHHALFAGNWRSGSGTGNNRGSRGIRPRENGRVVGVGVGLGRRSF